MSYFLIQREELCNLLNAFASVSLGAKRSGFEEFGSRVAVTTRNFSSHD
jgi:hypothetical protein